MPYIKTHNQTPGIRGLMEYRPKTGMALSQLAQALLVDSSSLTRFERELIASYVSGQNHCQFCTNSHTAIALELASFQEREILEQVKRDPSTASVTPKMRALLKIAGLVQQTGLAVTQSIIDEAKIAGSTDEEIHDAILISAAFCMFNRYVDGLGAESPTDPIMYKKNAEMISQAGYVR